MELDPYQTRRQISPEGQLVQVTAEATRMKFQKDDQPTVLGSLKPRFAGDMSALILYREQEGSFAVLGLLELPEWALSHQETYDQLMGSLLAGNYVGQHDQETYFRPIDESTVATISLGSSSSSETGGQIMIQPRRLSTMNVDEQFPDFFSYSGNSQDVDKIILGITQTVASAFGKLHQMSPDAEPSSLHVKLPRTPKIAKELAGRGRRRATAGQLGAAEKPEVPKLLPGHEQFPAYEALGGLDDQITQLRDYVDVIHNPESLVAYGLTRPGAVMLLGPGGVGKTALVQAFCRENRGRLESVSNADFLEKWVGEPVKKLRETLRGAANQKGLSVLFFDEFDGLFRNDAGGNSGVALTLVSELKTFLNDAPRKYPNLVVMAAANSLSGIDPALLRAGRFDVIIDIPPPDEAARAAIFGRHLCARAAHFALGDTDNTGIKTVDDFMKAAGSNPDQAGMIRVDELARLSDGFVGADIRAVIQRVLFEKRRLENSAGSAAPIGQAGLAAAIAYHRRHRGSDI